MSTLEILGREAYFPSLPQDFKLSTGQASALLHIHGSERAKEFKNVFNKEVREGKDVVMKGLSDMDLVYGLIQKGSTQWALTQLGGMVVTSIEILVTDYANRKEQQKATLKPLPFDEKMSLGYYDIDNETASDLMDDLCKEYNVVGNPKAGKAFSLAYEYGHSNGYHEVASYFRGIVELIKD